MVNTESNQVKFLGVLHSFALCFIHWYLLLEFSTIISEHLEVYERFSLILEHRQSLSKVLLIFCSTWCKRKVMCHHITKAFKLQVFNPPSHRAPSPLPSLSLSCMLLTSLICNSNDISLISDKCVYFILFFLNMVQFVFCLFSLKELHSGFRPIFRVD